MNASSSARTILVVDDDPITRNTVKMLLEVNAYAVETAGDGYEALEKAQTAAPDLVITDIRMPKMDGLRLLSSFRHNETLESVPFIFLTGHSDDVVQRQAMNEGGDDFLKKPFLPDDIVRAVQTRLMRFDLRENKQHALAEKKKYRSVRKLDTDLRTNISVIRGAVKTLMEDEATRSNKVATLLAESAEKLHHSIGNYLLFLHASNNFLFPYDAYHVSTDEVRRYAADAAARYQRTTDLHLTIDPFTVAIHPEYLKKMVMELVDNAMKFSPDGSRVMVMTRVAGNNAELVVQDAGRGMPKTFVKEIDAFVQHDRLSSAVPGLGLGLYLVRKLAEIHGGSVEINSKPNIGTTVQVVLPIK